jgi:predicted DNA-binding transcriptional regulator AlpA
MNARLPYPPPFQDLATLSAHISVGESTIENWVKQGLFPEPRKVGGKRLWQWKAVEKHLAAQSETVGTSDISIAERITNATRQAAHR